MASAVFKLNKPFVATQLNAALKDQALNAVQVSREAKLPDHTVYNFLQKQGGNVASLQAIAEVLGKDLSYFDPNYKEEKPEPLTNTPYDADLYMEILGVINEVLKKRNASISKEAVDKIAHTIYVKSQSSGTVDRDYAIGAVDFTLSSGFVEVTY